MILNHTTFYDELDSFQAFPELITDLAEESFKNVFDCDMARKHKNIVYVWRAEKKIKRLKGESDIIYIGQTDKATFLL